MRAHLAVILAVWTVAAGAHAQTTPDNRWSDAVEVVITAPKTVTIRARCPAMWKLTKDGATVWVMPTLLENKNGGWDQTCFKRTLKGATAIYLPGEYEGVPSEKTDLPPGKTLKDVVSPQTYARFKAGARRVHEPTWSYEHLRPGWAANYFVTVALNNQGIGHETAPDQMAKLARDAGAKAYEVMFYAPTSGQRNIRNQLDAAGDEACLKSVLDRLDYSLDVLPKIIEAWRHSDMATVLANWPADDDRCVPAGMGEAAKGTRENVARWTGAMETALSSPGRSVAAIPLPWLLQKDGVLDQLRAEGVTVTAPKGVEDELLGTPQ